MALQMTSLNNSLLVLPSVARAIQVARHQALQTLHDGPDRDHYVERLALQPFASGCPMLLVVFSGVGRRWTSA